MWFRHFQWIWDYRVLGNTDGGQLLSQMPSVLDFGSTGYSHPDNMFTNLSEFSQIFTNEWNWIFLNEHIYIKKTVLMAQFFYEQKCSNNRFQPLIMRLLVCQSCWTEFLKIKFQKFQNSVATPFPFGSRAFKE